MQLIIHRCYRFWATILAQSSLAGTFEHLDYMRHLRIIRVPPNVRFEIDDVEAEWTYHEKFDYIHCRFMGNAIQDWPRLVRQCFE